MYGSSAMRCHSVEFKGQGANVKGRSGVIISVFFEVEACGQEICRYFQFAIRPVSCSRNYRRWWLVKPSTFFGRHSAIRNDLSENRSIKSNQRREIP